MLGLFLPPKMVCLFWKKKQSKTNSINQKTSDRKWAVGRGTGDNVWAVEDQTGELPTVTHSRKPHGKKLIGPSQNHTRFHSLMVKLDPQSDFAEHRRRHSKVSAGASSSFLPAVSYVDDKWRTSTHTTGVRAQNHHKLNKFNRWANSFTGGPNP